MKLVACQYCGCVLDQKIIEMREDSDAEFIPIWNGDDWVRPWECPVCKTMNCYE